MPVPHWTEDARLEALHSYDILDTPYEAEFDDIVKLASQICGTPISIVNLIDKGRQWFKAEIGFGVRETPLDNSICAHAILQSDLFVIPDTTKDSRFQSNPLVTGNPKLRFYAGALLETEDKLPLGTLCVLDYKPRELNKQQLFALKALARQVMTQFELRHALKEKKAAEARMLIDMEEKRKVEKERDRFFNVTTDLLVKAGFDGYFKQANPAWEKVLGWTVEELLSKQWIDFLHPDDVQKTIDAGKEAFSGKVLSGLENRYICKGGGYRWMMWRTQTVMEEQVVYCAATDITDIREAEKKLHEKDVRLATALEAGHMGTWELDVQRGHLTCSDTCRANYGLGPDEELTYQKLPTLVHPEDIARWQSVICEAIDTGGDFEMEYRILWPDASIHWMFVRGTATKIIDGKAAFLSGVSINITERKHTELKAAELDAQFRQLADSIPQLAWMTDNAGRAFWYNQRWYDFTGTDFEEMADWGWRAVHHPDYVDGVFERIQNSFGKGLAWEDTFPLRGKHGDYRWFLSRAFPITDITGKIIRWFGTNTDITEQREAQQKAESANVAKTEFLANMSHEIRTPMNAVIGLSHILAMSQPLAPKQKEYIKTLQMSADSLLSLINDLLDIAKIEARTVELERIPFSVVQLVQETISMMNVRAKEKGLNFGVEQECACIEKRKVLGDPSRLRQILLNLCSNAVKFTERGGIFINISCDPIEGHNKELVKIAIKDTGMGIPPNKLEDIFQKFTQADSSISRKYGGTGLGLAITKTLAEIMGGTIEVQSEVGTGSTFTVSLPFDVATDDFLEHTHEIANVAQDTVQNKFMARILLVEDYAPNVMVATTFLEQFGYAVDVAENGIEAIEKIKNYEYIAVLMDVQMHGMNGLEATQHIRAFEKKNGKPKLHIIGMTAHALAGDRERCMGAGMNDYIAKPFNPENLKQMLSQLTEDSTV